MKLHSPGESWTEVGRRLLKFYAVGAIGIS